ncbi:MAG: hypothetical protein AAB432_01495 [Patescibacteria group bacterium]
MPLEKYQSLSGESFETNENKNFQAERMLELTQKIIEEAEKIEIRPNDRNKEGDLLVSPEGPVSNLGKQNELYWRMARTETFKEFFGDWQNKLSSSSKIVDTNGEPLVVFRGVSKDLSSDNFYNKEFYKKNVTGIERGVHVSPSHRVASEEYSGDGGTYGLFVNARKPAKKESVRRGIEEMVDEIFYIPRKYLRIPKFSPHFYDCVLGVNRNIALGDRSVSLSSKKLEDLYEIVVRDPQQILILPSTFRGKTFKNEG